MNYKKVTAYFAIIMGVAMIVMWIFFFAVGSVPEIETKPAELALHLLAEFITAVLLFISGIRLLVAKKWGLQIYLVAAGMLFYTMIISPGYFLQQGEPAFGVMFAVFIILALFFTVKLLAESRDTRK
ncbi:MAG: hypothetical protein Q7J85_01955 [Bacillota bacterium]|nr:hypothetical protein [Bacillota bacterium]